MTLLDPGCWYKVTYLVTNSADPDQFGIFRSQLIWMYTVCKDRAYPGSAGLRLKSHKAFKNMKKKKINWGRPMHGLIISYWKCFVTFRVQCCKSTALQINCELHCEKMDLMTCASSDEPAQPSHLHSLIRQFSGYFTLQKHASSNI